MISREDSKVLICQGQIWIGHAWIWDTLLGGIAGELQPTKEYMKSGHTSFLDFVANAFGVNVQH